LRANGHRMPPWRRMSLRRLRTQCLAHLAGIEIPQPFVLEAFCDSVASSRGRPLHLHVIPDRDPKTPDESAPCGVWVATSAADHIFHARTISALHQQHIILHEIGHMLCDHVVDGDEHGLARELLFPDLDSALIDRVLRRAGYSTPQEQVAEMMASMILGWVDVPTARGGDDQVLDGLSEIFGPAALDPRDV
jgi:hypothetical protein